MKEMTEQRKVSAVGQHTKIEWCDSTLNLRSQDTGQIRYVRDQMHVWPDKSKSFRVGKKAAGAMLDGELWDQFPKGDA